MRFSQASKVRVGRVRHLQITGQHVEDSSHVGGALNIGVAAQRIDATAGTSDIAEQKLQHRGGADGLRAGGMLGPADGVNNRGDLLHVTVFANRRKEVCGLMNWS